MASSKAYATKKGSKQVTKHTEKQTQTKKAVALHKKISNF